MPTPDGREWLAPRDIIKSQIETVLRNHPNITRTQLENLRDSLVEGYRDTGFGVELKLMRLNEKLKNAVLDGRITTIEEVKEAFKLMYSMDFLDQHDDDGNVKERENG